MVDREEVADLLGRFHRNSCYPEAMDGELFAYADQIIALFGAVASTICPNCRGTKRAEYFSEQSWSYEWRTCHKCDVASPDRPGTTECDHCRGTGRVNVNPFAPDNTMVSEILAADAAPQEASHNNAEDMLRWLNDEPVARPNRTEP